MAYVLIATDSSVNKYKGNSIDTKPSDVPNGSRCFETDTRRVWVYDSSHKNPGTNTNWWPDYVGQEDFLDLLNDSVNDAQLGDIVNVKSFGAKGDGTTDDTTSMQVAHNTGKFVYYPEGTYKFSTITMVSGGIIGRGQKTILQSTNTDGSNLISFTGDGIANTPIFRDFYLNAPSSVNSSEAFNAKTGGSGIYISPTNDAEGYFANISNVHFRYIPIGISFNKSASFVVTGCNFFFYKTNGIFVSNTKNVDNGDSSITNCHFFNGSSVTVGYGIWQESSGGLKITSNKFNGGAGGYLLDVKGTTSDLLFVGNSVENVNNTGLNFNNNLNTVENPVRFSNIVINGNQFARNYQDIIFNAIPNYSNLSYWDSISIIGNTFLYRGTLNSISLATMRVFNISNNTFFGEGVGNRGILIYDTCSNGKIGINSFYGLTQDIFNNGVSIPVEKEKIVGTGSGTTTTLYGGGIYYGSVSVNFGYTFTTPPLVMANVNWTSSGGISVAVDSVTTTGATFYVHGVSNSSSVNFTWVAFAQ